MGRLFRLDGTDLFKEIYDAIYGCLNDGVEKKSILSGLIRHKNNDEVLEEIRESFLSPNDEKDLIKKHLSLYRYPGWSIKLIKKSFKKSENK